MKVNFNKFRYKLTDTYNNLLEELEETASCSGLELGESDELIRSFDEMTRLLTLLNLMESDKADYRPIKIDVKKISL